MRHPLSAWDIDELAARYRDGESRFFRREMRAYHRDGFVTWTKREVRAELASRLRGKTAQMETP